MKKKRYKSKINARIKKLVGRLGIFLAMFFLAIGMTKVSGTNSFYTSNAISDGNIFTFGYWVPPVISISSPSLGDEWQVGSSHNITWTASSADPSATAGMLIDIDYACDSDPWTNIATGTDNDGSYSWTVPTDISDSCKVKITATDSHSLTASEESDEFEISYMIVLNEFVPYPAVGLDEMVEIYNYGTEPVNVNNWFITDNQGPASHRRLIDSAHSDTGSTTINPSSNRFLVIENYADFYLNNTGDDEVQLYDSAGNLIDSHDYSNAVQGKSYARIPDGVGNWVDPVPTPGEKNNSSNDLDDMQKYYKEACFKDGKPICKESFLKSLGLLKEEKIEEVVLVADEIVENPEVPVEDIASDNTTDGTISNDDNSVSDSVSETGGTEANSSEEVLDDQQAGDDSQNDSKEGISETAEVEENISEENKKEEEPKEEKEEVVSEIKEETKIEENKTKEDKSGTQEEIKKEEAKTEGIKEDKGVKDKEEIKKDDEKKEDAKIEENKKEEVKAEEKKDEEKKEEKKKEESKKEEEKSDDKSAKKEPASSAGKDEK